MVLSPNEFMFVSDQTKGNVDVYVGPTKQPLSEADRPVIFDEVTKRFVETDLKQGKQLERIAPEGWYVVLKNPAPENKQPVRGSKQGGLGLDVGRKVNIPGPCSLFLWPGQMAKVLKGHHLRSNQYLLVRVYDDRAAQENWGKAVVKPAEGTAGVPAAPKPIADAKRLTMGQVLVIKGVDVSFYIPPTGVEVIADADGKLVRDAVTLERLEYCLLMDESGKKRYEQGPAVVFPEPTEVFVDREGSRKARAIELNENVGIYVKVIADYEEEGKKYEVGDELFITGNDQMIYFPREEHAIIQYGAHDRHYGVAIPAGEGRYVLDRLGGEVSLVKGPKVFLPDPRKEVIVRRVLDAGTCDVLFPGNQAAKGANARLAGVTPEEYSLGYFAGASGPIGMLAAATGTRQITSWAAMNSAAALGGRSLEPEVGMQALYAAAAPSIVDTMSGRGLAEAPGQGFAGDQIQRKGTYTAPRALTLDTKYEGAVAVDVWTGYAMMLVRKSGERRVVVGPQTVLLAYDEAPQVLQLSSGKPKTTDRLIRTAYLRVSANWVTDVLEVETRDFCKIKVKLSYRLNFEGPSEKWFGVENYVKHLTDHGRSKLRAAVQLVGVEEFYGNHAAFIRDVLLGKGGEGEKARPGLRFEENGMRVYDVEVLGLELADAQIAQMMSGAQRQAVSTSIQLATQRRALEVAKETEKLKQDEAVARAETTAKQIALSEAELARRLEFELASIEAESKKEGERLESQKANEEGKALVSAIVLKRETALKEAAIVIAEKTQAVELAAIKAEADALIAKAGAVSPDLVAALQAFSDRYLAAEAAKAMGPMALLGGESVADVLAKLLRNTPLAKNLIANGNGQMGAKPATATPAE